MADSQSKLILSVETSGAVTEVEKLKLALQGLHTKLESVATPNLASLNGLARRIQVANKQATSQIKGASEALVKEATRPLERLQQVAKKTSGSLSEMFRRTSLAMAKGVPLTQEAKEIAEQISELDKAATKAKKSTEKAAKAVYTAGRSQDGVGVRSKLALGDLQDAEKHIRTLEAVQKDAGAQMVRDYHREQDRQAKLEKSRRAFRTRMFNMNKEFDAKDLKAQQAAILKAERLYSEGYRTTEVARTSGVGSKAALIARNNIKAGNPLSLQLDAQYGKVRSSASGATKATQGFNQAARETHALARGLSGSLNALWMTYGSLLPLLGGALVGSVAKNVYTTGKDLEYQLKFIEALGNTPIQVEDMMPAVMGSMKTPMEAAEALMALTQAGLSSKQALEALSSTMQLSTFGGLGMEEAATSMTTTLAAFNLGISEASRVGDVFAKAAAVSNTSVAQITESMKQASTAASQYGISVEEVSAGLAVLAENNITGSAAGTAYRNMLKELYTPIARGEKAFNALGLSAFKASGEVKPLTQVLQELRAKLAGVTDEVKSKTLEAMFGERAGRAIRPILDDLDSYIEKTREMGEAQGFLAEGSSKLMDTVEGDANRIASAMQQAYAKSFAEVNSELRILMNNILNLTQSETIGGVFTGIAQGAITLISTITQMSDTLATMVIAYGAGRAALIAWNLATGKKAIALKDSIVNLKNSTLATMGNTKAINDNTKAKQANANAGQTADGGSTTIISRAGRVANAIGRVNFVLGAGITAYTLATTAMGIYNQEQRKIEADAQRVTLRVKTMTEELLAQAKAGDEAIRARSLMEGGQVAETAVVRETLELEKQKLFNLSVQARMKQEEITAKETIIKLGEKEAKSLERQLGSASRKRKISNDQKVLESTINQLGNERSEILAQHLSTLNSVLGAESAILNVIRMQVAARAQSDMLSGMAPLRAFKDDLKDLEASALIGQLTPAQAGYKKALEGARLGDIEKGLNLTFNARNEALTEGINNLTKRMEEDARLASKQKNSAKADDLVRMLSQINTLGNAGDLQRGLEAVRGTEYEADAEKLRVIAAEMEDFSIATTAVSKSLANAMEPFKKRIDEEATIADAPKDSGGGGYKPTREEKYDNRLNNQAYKLIASTRAEANRAERASVTELNKLYDELNAKYFTEEVNRAIEARNAAEEPFNKLIEDRKTKMEELEDVIINGSERGSEYTLQQVNDAKIQLQELARTIEELEARKAQAGALGYSYGQALFKEEFSFSARMLEETTKLQNEIDKVGYTVADSIVGSFDSMTEALANFVATGDLSIKEFAANTLAELSKMAFKIAANQILMTILGSFMNFGGVTTGVASGTMGGVGAISSNFPAPIMSAKGNAFNHGSVTKFARGGAFTNTIARGTTVAPMAMFGEAGPEAIMPLTRMPGGDLGIKAIPTGAEGISGGNNISVVTNVVVNSDGSASTSTQSNVNGEETFKQLSEQLAAENRRIIEKELRQGGLIYQYVRANK